MMPADEHARILHNAIDWAMEAGKIQLEKFRSRHLSMETKTTVHDVVTEVDKACEQHLIERISATYPTHSILGEETGAHQQDSEWRWVIDPLDGTNNYSQGLPIFCVSIGVQRAGVTQVGVVYVPYLDELFTAQRGGGASWNGKAIHVGHKTDLDQCVVGTGFPYDKGVNPDNNLANLNRILPHLRGLRRMGAAAYDLCCVACGLLDGYWELDLKPWDACAGALIVEEAGGIVLPFRSDRNISVVAGNKAVADRLMGLLQEASPLNHL
jgi:myo-inositol-1(or 4)-monophosphatase